MTASMRIGAAQVEAHVRETFGEVARAAHSQVRLCAVRPIAAD